MATQHTTRCEQDWLRRQAWERQFPHYCRNCDATGGPPDDCCSNCVGKGYCPRCGRLQFFHWQERLAVRVDNFIWWAWDACNRIVHRRKRHFGISGARLSWHNWPEKLAWYVDRFLLKVRRPIYSWLDGPEDSPFEDPAYTCPYCGWDTVDGMAPTYECWCWEKEICPYDVY